MAKNNNKQDYTTEKVLESLNETAHKAESFFEKNSKIIIGACGALAVIAIGYFVYLKYVIEPKSESAFTEMVQADEYFKQDSILLALKGSPGSFQGYEQIIKEYSGTEGANIAHYKAGVSYYRLGDYASAVEHLEKFSTDDDILTAQKNGMIGNALVQSGKMEKALEYYAKAASSTNVETFETMYNIKAGQIAMELKKDAEALKYFQAVKDKYPNNTDVDKYIERLKYTTGGNWK